MAEHPCLHVLRGSARWIVLLPSSRIKQLVGCVFCGVLCSAQPMSTIPEKLGMVFWILPLCLQPLIALAMASRRLIRSFSIFFMYTLFVSTRDLVLLCMRHDRRTYSWVYFLSEPFAIGLGVAVVYEAVWHLIQLYSNVRSVWRRLFWGSTGIMFLAGLTMLRTSEFGRTKFWIDSLFLAERSARFFQVAVLIVFILFISHLGLTWKHYTSGIVAGFGIAAGLQLALYEIRATHGITDSRFYLLMSMAYNIAVVVWTMYFLPPRRESEMRGALPQTDLPRWDVILRRYLRR